MQARESRNSTSLNTKPLNICSRLWLWLSIFYVFEGYGLWSSKLVFLQQVHLGTRNLTTNLTTNSTWHLVPPPTQWIQPNDSSWTNIILCTEESLELLYAQEVTYLTCNIIHSLSHSFEVWKASCTFLIQTPVPTQRKRISNFLNSNLSFQG